MKKSIYFILCFILNYSFGQQRLQLHYVTNKMQIAKKIIFKDAPSLKHKVPILKPDNELQGGNNMFSNFVLKASYKAPFVPISNLQNMLF